MNNSGRSFKFKIFIISFINDLGDACIKQDIQLNEARATASAPTLQSCETLVPILSSHDTEETGHNSLKECTAIDDEVDMDGKTEVMVMSFFPPFVCIYVITSCLKSL